MRLTFCRGSEGIQVFAFTSTSLLVVIVFCHVVHDHKSEWKTDKRAQNADGNWSWTTCATEWYNSIIPSPRERTRWIQISVGNANGSGESCTALYDTLPTRNVATAVDVIILYGSARWVRRLCGRGGTHCNVCNARYRL